MSKQAKNEKLFSTKRTQSKAFISWRLALISSLMLGLFFLSPAISYAEETTKHACCASKNKPSSEFCCQNEANQPKLKEQTQTKTSFREKPQSVIRIAANEKKVDLEHLAPVLDSGQFFGPAAMGYAAAKVVPKVCAQLFCYCGCDITDNHTNLLDCFTGYHGADCHICQEEALMALKLDRQDLPVAAIQQRIDETYANQYPFKQPSATLLKYWATRLYKPVDPNKPAGNPKAEESTSCCNPNKKEDKQSGSQNQK